MKLKLQLFTSVLVVAACIGEPRQTTTSTVGPGTQLERPAQPQPQIAFECQSVADPDICVMNADGTGLQVLTGEYSGTTPDWAWDGSKLAFASARDLLIELAPGFLAKEIYIMDTDGSHPTRLTDNEADDALPRWSPDGTQVAFTSNRDGQYEIYVMGRDGTSQINLTRHPAYDADPTWSPDGSLLAFFSDREPMGVYVMTAEGTDVELVLSGVSTPAWSPDGEQLAVIGWVKAEDFDIFLADLRSGTVTPLSTRGGWLTEPAWSRDGNRIAFRRGQSGPGAEIYVINSDGSAETGLTENQTHDAMPTWSP